MTPPVVVPLNLPDLVRAAFARARAAGELLFFPTQAALLRVQGIPFQLRFAPSLARKPKAASAATAASQPAAPAVDPFEDPPAGLLVAPQLGPAHRLVLNKFAICQEHAILATAAFQPQHHLLAAADLAAAYACIEAYHAAGAGAAAADPNSQSQGEELFVFYNSGPHSGASQPHRHLQMLPVAGMRQGLADADAAAWTVLVDRLLPRFSSSPSPAPQDELPFVVKVARIRDSSAATDTAGPSPDQLHSLYLDLYAQACAAASVPLAPDDEATRLEVTGQIPARISYNLALTHTTMAVCPRTADGSPVFAAAAAAGRMGSGPGGRAAEAPSPVGMLSLNGTLLAGTALVKNAAEWEALRADDSELGRVLASIGIPTHGRSVL